MGDYLVGSKLPKMTLLPSGLQCCQERPEFSVDRCGSPADALMAWSSFPCSYCASPRLAVFHTPHAIGKFEYRPLLGNKVDCQSLASNKSCSAADMITVCSIPV